MAVTVNRVVQELDDTMRTLDRRLRGIPYRIGSFRTTHRNLTRAVAHLLVQLDAAKPALDNSVQR